MCVCVCVCVSGQVYKQASNDWMYGELQSRGKQKKMGWFPSGYIEILQRSDGPSLPGATAQPTVSTPIRTQRARSVCTYMYIHVHVHTCICLSLFLSFPPSFSSSLPPSPASSGHPGPPGISQLLPKSGVGFVHLPGHKQRRTLFSQGECYHGLVEGGGMVEG